MNKQREYNNYPKDWHTYDFHANSYDSKSFNFSESIGDVNRFGSRFRIAKAFKGLNLDGYNQLTVDGYSSLCRVLLTWSAFEQFMSIMGVKQATLHALLSKYESVELQKTIRVIDKEDRFYKFIYERVNDVHKKELDNYFNEDPCNITYLASAIRHIFAHGTLTPNSNEVDPNVVIELCNKLCNALLDIMDIEFTEKMNAFEQENYPRY